MLQAAWEGCMLGTALRGLLEMVDQVEKQARALWASGAGAACVAYLAATQRRPQPLPRGKPCDTSVWVSAKQRCGPSPTHLPVRLVPKHPLHQALPSSVPGSCKLRTQAALGPWPLTCPQGAAHALHPWLKGRPHCTTLPGTGISQQ